MKVKELKELLASVDDNLEVVIDDIEGSTNPVAYAEVDSVALRTETKNTPNPYYSIYEDLADLDPKFESVTVFSLGY